MRFESKISSGEPGLAQEIADNREDSMVVSTRRTPAATVLVIDDDPSVIRLIEKSLEGSATVYGEFGAPESGELDLSELDLVFLDYKMPVRDGLDILLEIREERPDLPVVFLTGFGTPEFAEKAKKGGANAILAKPVGPGLIRKTAQVYLGAFSYDNRRFEVEPGSTLDEWPGMRPPRSFEGVDPKGNLVSGDLVRFGSEAAVVDFNSEHGLGSQLRDIRLAFGRQQVKSAHGVITRCEAISRNSFRVEILMPGAWGVSEGEDEEPGNNVAKPSASQVSRQVKQSDLPEQFRLATYELCEILKSVQQDCLLFENLRDGALDTVERLRADESFVQDTSKLYSPEFWKVMVRFEDAARALEALDEIRVAKEFARKVMFPMALSSPFLARVVEKPIGVPGDFGMLGQILGNPLEGSSLYDRIFNSWILSCGAADAYRYRVNLLYREIRQKAEQAKREGRTVRVLSMASGVAYEIQRYLEDPLEGCEIEFVMVDFSTDTLKEAERQYRSFGTLPEMVKLEMHQSSVIDLANRSRGFSGAASDGAYEPDGEFDLVYCAGLFDYLSDRLIVKVISYLHGLLREGGRLAVSNFTVKNPIQSWMTLVMDWELIYRSEAQFIELMGRGVGDATFEIEIDHGGVEVYGLSER
ncbi:MAG: response regulator [Verrucomicrobiales bacterium]|nr:response regulator [Verrucomicrobiales bacterium]